MSDLGIRKVHPTLFLRQALGGGEWWRWPCQNRLQWRARQDSNLRPSAPEADALSAELQARDAAEPGRRRPAAREPRIAATRGPRERRRRRPLGWADAASGTWRSGSRGGPENCRRIRSGSRRSRFVAVPVKGRPAETDRLLPRYKGIYHVGCTDYPNPTYP